MKKISLAVLTAAVGIAANAQQKLWTEGPLTWDDFNVVSQADEPSLGVISLVASHEKVKIGHIKYTYTGVHAAFDTKISFVREDSRTDAELALNQKIFNIYESCARDMRDNLVANSGDVAALRKTYQKEAAERVAKLKSDPHNTAQNLPKDDFEPSLYNVFGKNKYMFGVAAASNISLGALTDMCTSASGAEVYGGYNIGRHTIMADINVLPLKTYKGGIWIPETQTRLCFSVSLLYGYRIFEKERFNFGFFAGPGFGIHYSDNNLAGFLITEGLQAEYNLASIVSLAKASPDRTDINLFARVGSGQLINDGMYASINVAIGVNFSICSVSKSAVSK